MKDDTKKYLLELPVDKHRLFKIYCVSKDISLNNLFIQGAEQAVKSDRKGLMTRG